MQLKHRKFRQARILAFLLATLACAVVAHADEAGDRPIAKLELTVDSRFHDGKVALMQGTADAAGDRFELPNTDLTQPIAVDVYTRGAPAGAVRLRVGKGDWSSPARDGTTDATGRVGFRFRTYDGVKFWVTADTPTPYQIIVWSGAPIELPPPSFATPMSVYVQRHPDAVPTESASSIGHTALLAVIALLVMVMAIVIVVLVAKRRKPTGADT